MQEYFIDIDEKAIEETMIKANIPGVSIAFVSNRGNITPREIGVTDKGSKSKVSKETVFGAASLSKVVFAYIVLKLIQEKKLSFDEKLNDTLSFGDFCNQNGLQVDPNAENIQCDIKSILSHTTGLDIDNADKKIKYHSNPRNYWYSGIPLYYLQKVIEAKMKQPLEELAKQYVFDVCSMAHSTFFREYDLAPLPENNETTLQSQTLYIQTNEEKGLTYKVIGLDGELKERTIPWEVLPEDFPHNEEEIIASKKNSLSILLRYSCAENHTTKENAHCANSLFTTAEDYAKFINKWMNDKDENMQAAFNEMVCLKKDEWANGMKVPQDDLKKIGWGLGWGLEFDDNESDTPRKAARAYHTGDMNKWRSCVAIDRQKNIALVYFANAENGHVLQKKIIEPHVKFEHVPKYFSEKFGFSVSYEEDFEIKQNNRFANITRYLKLRSNPTEKQNSPKQIMEKLSTGKVNVDVSLTSDQEKNTEGLEIQPKTEVSQSSSDEKQTHISSSPHTGIKPHKM